MADPFEELLNVPKAGPPFAEVTLTRQRWMYLLPPAPLPISIASTELTITDEGSLRSSAPQIFLNLLRKPKQIKKPQIKTDIIFSTLKPQAPRKHPQPLNYYFFGQLYFNTAEIAIGSSGWSMIQDEGTPRGS